MPERLRISDLRLTIGEKPLLRGISLSMSEGETVALCGRSGSGKSTLLRCICCLQAPDTGDGHLDGSQYLVRGRCVKAPFEVRRQIIMVFQNYCLFPNLSGRENLTLPLKSVLGMNPRDADDLASYVSRALLIEPVLKRFPSEMSGGEQQRLALARALVLRPKVMLMDEVTNATDPETTKSMVEAVEHMREIQEVLPNAGGTRRTSILLVTHLFRFAESFSDRIAFLHDGLIVEDHPARQFRHRSTNVHVKRYLDSII